MLNPNQGTEKSRLEDQPLWYCVRQRAGALVKECRALRPRFSRDDPPDVRREKNEIVRNSGDSSVCRTRRDRLELRLALFGGDGVFYTLTFDREHEPKNFDEVRRRWRSFLRRLKLWKPEWSGDYIYLIEGRHGDHRLHIHAVLRDSEFPPAVVRYLWRFGTEVEDQPLLRNGKDSYSRLAEYMNKERSDGITIPIDKKLWVASRSLRAKLPAVEKWRDSSGNISIPEGAVILRQQLPYRNRFGVYSYAAWMEPWEPNPTNMANSLAIRGTRARARSNLK